MGIDEIQKVTGNDVCVDCDAKVRENSASVQSALLEMICSHVPLPW